MLNVRWKLLLVCATACMFLGCGGPAVEKGVVVTGKVLKAGAPIPGMRPEVGLGTVQITLMPLSPAKPDAEPGVALLKADGSFEVLGVGKGIPPGKYKVVIMQRDVMPGAASAIPDSFSEAKSNFEVDIPANKVGDKHDLGTIDVDQPPAS